MAQKTGIWLDKATVKRFNETLAKLPLIGKNKVIVKTMKQAARPIQQKLEYVTTAPGIFKNPDKQTHPVKGRTLINKLNETIQMSKATGKINDGVRIGLKIKKKGYTSFHAGFLEEGTKKRTTKNGANRGSIKRTDFFEKIWKAVAPSAIRIFEARLTKNVETEYKKITGT